MFSNGRLSVLTIEDLPLNCLHFRAIPFYMIIWTKPLLQNYHSINYVSDVHLYYNSGLLLILMFNCLFSRDGENLDAGTETHSNLNHEVYYHFLGTDQSEDILCWRDPDNPKHSHSVSVTEDGKVLTL